MRRRQALVKRKTKETDIRLSLNIDGVGKSKIHTGIPFFDHMLTLYSKHSVMDLTLTCRGDLDIDAHHTVEDCGLALGQAIGTALGAKKGIRRYGHGFGPESGTKSAPKSKNKGETYVPMDESLARCVVDFGGRPMLVWRGMSALAYKRLTKAEKNQDLACAFRFGLAREFFQGFTNEARCNLHLELLYGDEPHHVVEGLFKAFGKALDVACQRDARISGRLPTTKGAL